MFDGKKDIYINQTKQNMFLAPDNEVLMQQNVFLPTFKIQLMQFNNMNSLKELYAMNLILGELDDTTSAIDYM